MKNLILSAAFVLGALGVNASSSLVADFNAPTELVAEDGCTNTTSPPETTIHPDGSSTTVVVSYEVCD